jgi:hypothetical protein
LKGIAPSDSLQALIELSDYVLKRLY